MADIIGKLIVMKIVEDKTRGDETYRALTVVREADYLEEVTRERERERDSRDGGSSECKGSGGCSFKGSCGAGRG